MNKLFLATLAITIIYFNSAAEAFIKPDSCAEGNVCAIVCFIAHTSTPEVHLSGFAQIGSSGRIHRTIIERLGSTSDEQIRQHLVELTEANRYVSDLFDSAMEHVKRTTDFAEGRSGFPNVVSSSADQIVYQKNSCELRTLAEYSPFKHIYIVDQDLYQRLNATDRAGMWSNLAFKYIAKSQGKNDLSIAEKIVNQLFYGNEEDHDRVKLFKTSPMTKSEKLEKVRELLNPLSPPEPNEDENS